MTDELVGRKFGIWEVLLFEKKGNEGHYLYRVQCGKGHKRLMRRGVILNNTHPVCRYCERAMAQAAPTRLMPADYLTFAEYTKKALATESVPPQDTPIDLALLWGLLRMSTLVGGMLDQYKRRLFYGKDIDHMKMTAFYTQLQKLVFDDGKDPVNTYRPTDVVTTDLRAIHGVLGILTESNELGERLLMSLKRGFYEYNGGQFDAEDKTNFNEEIGDVCWYLAQLQDSLGLGQQEILKGNVAKLEARYKGVFTSKSAIERDTAKEMIALNGVTK